jgi:hypothetical protein
LRQDVRLKSGPQKGKQTALFFDVRQRVGGEYAMHEEGGWLLAAGQRKIGDGRKKAQKTHTQSRIPLGSAVTRRVR